MLIDLEIHSSHIFIELDAEVKAELVKLFGCCGRAYQDQQNTSIIFAHRISALVAPRGPPCPLRLSAS